jgi:long-chain acyl-CoA synthetase
VITDRKKELLKTAGGKFVAPQPIENSLKMSPYVQSAVVIGDRRKFAVALIVPNFGAVAAEAAKQGMQFASPVEIAKAPWVHDLIAKEMARVNQHLPQYEAIKRFALLAQDFSFEKGELTYTMKLKRRVIDQHYQDVIEGLYAGGEESRQVATHPQQAD